MFFLSACSSVNVDPDNRSLDCSQYVSKSDDVNKLINIVTTGGESLNIVAIGSARQPQKINFKYSKGCYIDLARDVSRIVRIDDSKQEVLLNNGQAIEIGTYDSQWGLKATPYNKSPWSVIVETSLGQVDYHSKSIDPFNDLLTLTVIKEPVKSSSLDALLKLKLKEQEAYELKIKREVYEREQRKLNREKERKKAQEAEQSRRAKEAQQERQKRERAKEKVSRNDNIGRKICKDGTLEYSRYSGYAVLGQPQYVNTREQGQIQGYIEGFSQDGYRVKFRASGWATKTGKLKFNPTHAPVFEKFSTQQGTVHWDDVKDWFLCK